MVTSPSAGAGAGAGVEVEVGEGEDYDEDALRKYQLERLRYVSMSLLGGLVIHIFVDTTTLSSNVIPSKPLRMSSMNWREQSSNAPPTFLISASFLTT